MMKHSLKHELWPKYNAWVIIGAFLVFIMHESSSLFLAIAITSFLIFIASSRKVWQQFGWWGGWANIMTALRLLCIAFVVWQSTALHDYVIFALGIFALVADGLDGYFARKYHTVSAFGDCFDKETDAFFVLAYGVVIYQHNLAGGWVLIPGLLRYLYVIVLSLIKMKPEVPNPSFRRQLMGMWLMGTLLAPFIISPLIYIPGLIFAIILILFSFSVDLGRMVWRTREKILS